MLHIPQISVQPASCIYLVIGGKTPPATGRTELTVISVQTGLNERLYKQRFLRPQITTTLPSGDY